MVATESMEPTIMVGDIIIAKQVAFEEVQVEDIIVFIRLNIKNILSIASLIKTKTMIILPKVIIQEPRLMKNR